MIALLLIFAAILFASVFLNRISFKIGVPVLLLFLLVGFVVGLGVDIIGNVDASRLVEFSCTVALIFIMFYGGFGTRWSSAKPVAVEAGLLASVGVFLTAGITGLFCHYALGWSWVKSMMLGAVISSTDAASVFSILRTRKLGLKNNTAPMIEMESGSNDPCAYMVTVLMLAVANAADPASTTHVTVWYALWTVFSQLVFGAASGLLIAWGAAFLLKRYKFAADGFNTLFIFAVAIAAYALPNLVGGNGYLSAYIVGIVLGNTEFEGRRPLVGFFDGVTSLMQIAIFFALGMMADVHRIPAAILPALAIFAFLLLVARPAAVFSVLTPFRKYPANQMGFISFVGLRGASSIVFAIVTITQVLPGARPLIEGGGVDIFSVVFCVVVISILAQGTLIPFMAKKMKMVDENADVMTTFSDFTEQSEATFGRFTVGEGSKWAGHCTKEMTLPDGMVLVLLRRGNKTLVPKGHTYYEVGDEIIYCTRGFREDTHQHLVRDVVEPNSRWIGKTIKEYPYKDGMVFVMIERDGQSIIPTADGMTRFCAGDVLYIYRQQL
jgi:cell volume regulation protein A